MSYEKSFNTYRCNSDEGRVIIHIHVHDRVSIPIGAIQTTWRR